MDKANRLLVLTDFSEHSDNFINFAFSISEEINARMVLVHKIWGVAPAMADLDLRDEMVRSESEEAYRKMRKLAQGRIYSDNSFFVSHKPILSLLKDLASDHYFDWVLTGLKGTGAMKRLVIGSKSISIVNETNFLMMAVPMRFQVEVPKKLNVGVNPLYPLNKYQFKKILISLKNHIEEITFFSILKEDEDQSRIQGHLNKLQEEYKEYNPLTRIYINSNAVNSLLENAELFKNSFLVLQQGSRSLSDKLFRTSFINQIVYTGQFPLIVLSK